MILITDGAGFGGSVIPSRVKVDDEGYLSKADPAENSAPESIARAVVEGKALHVTTATGFEFVVTLRDATHAEIHPVGAPAIMKPIQAEKVD
jgi:hypothetical protein